MRHAIWIVVAAALVACGGDDETDGGAAGQGGTTSTATGTAAGGGTTTSAGVSGGGGSGAGGGGTPGGAYLVMEQSELEGLSTSSAAWDYLQARADEAVAVTLDAAAEGSPWLPNYNDSGDGARLPARFLAAAFVYASSYGGDKTPYRQAVEAALLHVMGSEEEASTDGTADGDRLLATARQLPAWVLAADLIAMDDSLMGTRTELGSDTGTDWTQTSFGSWLGTVLTKTIGTHGRWQSISQTQENSAANWGAHCTASRIAVSLYLGDATDVARATMVLRGALGDAASYPAYPDGQSPAPGEGFQTTSSFDSSWACNYSATVAGWLPINSDACGSDMDGIVVEDISRSAGAYPDYDSTGIGYTFETMAGLHLAALLLERQAEPAFGWSGEALRRAMEWLDRQGEMPGSSSVRQHVPWITNHFYDLDLPTGDARMGRGFGFTDWLYP